MVLKEPTMSQSIIKSTPSVIRNNNVWQFEWGWKKTFGSSRTRQCRKLQESVCDWDSSYNLNCNVFCVVEWLKNKTKTWLMVARTKNSPMKHWYEKVFSRFFVVATWIHLKLWIYYLQEIKESGTSKKCWAGRKPQIAAARVTWAGLIMPTSTLLMTSACSMHFVHNITSWRCTWLVPVFLMASALQVTC